MQPYDTAGDYRDDETGRTHINVSELGNNFWEHLLALHEYVEYIVVLFLGVSIRVIDDFDKQFEAERKMGMHSIEAEPGDDPQCPYHYAHCIATGVERMVCAAVMIRWGDYANAINSLVHGPARIPRRKKALALDRKRN